MKNNSNVMEKSINKYYYRLDIYRFVFTIFVVILHFETFYQTLPKLFNLSRSLYRAVDFFFLLSGFLLYKSFCSQRYSNALDFTFAKAKRIMPINFLVIIFTCFFRVFATLISSNQSRSLKQIIVTVKDFIIHVICAIPNMLFIQGFIPVYENILSGYYFDHLWYISVMLVVGFILFWFLAAIQKKYGDSFKGYGLVLIIAVIVFSNIFNISAYMDLSTIVFPGLNLPSGFLRGLADIGLGVFCANFTINITKKKILNVLKLFFPFSIFTLTFFAKFTKFDFVFVILCAFVLIFEFSLDEVPCKNIQRLCRFAGKMSVPIYFSHIFVIIIVYAPIIQKWESLHSNFPLDLLVRTILVFTLSFIFYYLSKLLEKPFSKLYACFKSDAN